MNILAAILNDPNVDPDLRRQFAKAQPRRFNGEPITGFGAIDAPRFMVTYCAQCGGEFGPGDAGYSHCSDHSTGEQP